MDFPRFFIVDFPLKNFENIVIGHFPFLLYRTFSFIVHFHGTPHIVWKNEDTMAQIILSRRRPVEFLMDVQ